MVSAAKVGVFIKLLTGAAAIREVWSREPRPATKAGGAPGDADAPAVEDAPTDARVISSGEAEAEADPAEDADAAACAKGVALAAEELPTIAHGDGQVGTSVVDHMVRRAPGAVVASRRCLRRIRYSRAAAVCSCAR